jgi:hypothetical protein
LEESRRELDFASGAFVHLHIFGRPGVGKTRFALEVCRDAPWCKSVLYVPQVSNASAGQLLDFIAQANEARLALVVDEVQAKDLRSLGLSAQSANGRIRLITIGHVESTDRKNIAQTEVKPLDEQTATKVIKSWHPNMPEEGVRYVVKFAGGFVRLAQMAALAVAKDPRIDTAKLLKQATSGR